MMKRKICTLFTLILAVFMSAFCFTGCDLLKSITGGVEESTTEQGTDSGSSNTEQETEKLSVKLENSTADQIVIKVEKTDGKANVLDALKSLRNQDLVSFDYMDSTYGAYITSINGKAEQVVESTMTSSKGYSWSLYTSDMELAYEEKTIAYGEIVCGQSSVGASSLIVKEGETYIWAYEYYDYTW